MKESPVTDRLKKLGATIFVGHSAENVAGAEVVVTSSAISRSNPEVAESALAAHRVDPARGDARRV